MYEAKALADLCAEQALEEIRENTAFTGANIIVVGNGQCDYLVTDTGGETRTIDVNGVVGVMTRQMDITVTAIDPLITIGSWQEAVF